jgi:uncharacterized membrane protein YfcA
LPEDVANGTNRLSVVVLGLMRTISFAWQGLIHWRKGAQTAVLIALGTAVSSLFTLDLSDTILKAITTGLLVLGMLLAKPSHWLAGKEAYSNRSAGVRLPTSPSASVQIWPCSGFFMLAALVLLAGCDLREENAMKQLPFLLSVCRAF